MEDDRYRPSEVNLPSVEEEAELHSSEPEYGVESAENLQHRFSIAELATEGIRKQPDLVAQKAIEAAENDQPAELQHEKRHEIMQNQSTQSPLYATQVGDIDVGAPLRQPGLENFPAPAVAPPLPQTALSGYPVQSGSSSLYRKSILRGFVAGIIVLICALAVLLVSWVA